MAQQAILREYLVALGFKVNTAEHKRMDGIVKNLDKRMLALGKAAVATTTAVVGMATIFAKQMEKLYYSARYADTTVEKLQGISYGASQVGIEAGRMQGAMKNFAAAIRSNPGLIGLLNSLGVRVQGRDKSDVMLDFVKALKGMPFYVAQQYAGLFGMDAETLFNMEAGLEKIRQAAEERRKMNEEAGLDADKAAEVAKEYMQMWREVEARAGVFGQTVMLAALPAVRQLAGVTNEVLKDWIAIVKKIGEAKPNEPGFLQSLREGITGQAEGGVRATLTEEQRRRIGAPRQSLPPIDPASPTAPAQRWWQNLQRWRDRKTGYLYGHQVATDPDAVDAVTSPVGPPGGSPSTTGNTQALFAALEAKYGLPAGILNRVWMRESSGGKNMLSPKGAMGHFGFMPNTAKAYGLKDPNDLAQSAEAAAHMYSDLLKQFGGNARLAAAGYNWGSGNVDNYLKQIQLGREPNMPEETQKYMDAVAPSITQNVDINISGVSDPQQAAQAVAREQRAVGADIVRNFSPKVR